MTPAWRIAIALGGPFANFLLAMLIFWVLFVTGVTGYVPILAATPGSAAERAGMVAPAEIVAIDGRPINSVEQIIQALAHRLGDSGTIEIATQSLDGERSKQLSLPITEWLSDESEPDVLGGVGFVPSRPARVGNIIEGEAAEAAGLIAGDIVTAVDGVPVINWDDWVTHIQAGAGQRLILTVHRAGRDRSIAITPGTKSADDGTTYGFAGVGSDLPTRQRSYGLLESVPMAMAETWDKTAMTLGFIRKMITGLVSTRTLAGPITIADVARDSLVRGVEKFLGILAVLSVSLGVLNLLPIPILDGGHIIYALIEWVRGKPVSDGVQMIGIQIGLVAVVGLTVLALSNDIARLLF